MKMRVPVNTLTLLRRAQILAVAGVVLSLLFVVRSILDYDSRSRAGTDAREDVTGPSGGAPARGLDDYSVVLRRNPFGFEAGTLDRLGREAPGSMGELTLMGTVAGVDGWGYAVLATDGGRQEVFRTGQQVYGMGRLSSVMTDRVRIGGADVSLIDPKTAFKRYGEGVRLPLRRAPEAPFIRRTSEGAYVVDRRKIEETIQNPQQLMTDARLQPMFNDGRQEGFVLKEVRVGGLYHRLGLRNNDVLLGINQYNITDPEAALQAFNALRGADRIVLRILRNGKRKTLVYQIK